MRWVTAAGWGPAPKQAGLYAACGVLSCFYAAIFEVRSQNKKKGDARSVISQATAQVAAGGWHATSLTSAAAEATVRPPHHVSPSLRILEGLGARRSSGALSGPARVWCLLGASAGRCAMAMLNRLIQRLHTLHGDPFRE